MSQTQKKRERPAPLILTEAAVARIKTLMHGTDQPILGLRLSVGSKGCSGMSYEISYAMEEKPMDQILDQDGARLYIDPGAIMFILGSTMDYQEGELESGFTFTNPNEKGRCGCGESFHI